MRRPVVMRLPVLRGASVIAIRGRSERRGASGRLHAGGDVRVRSAAMPRSHSDCVACPACGRSRQSTERARHCSSNAFSRTATRVRGRRKSLRSFAQFDLCDAKSACRSSAGRMGREVVADRPLIELRAHRIALRTHCCAIAKACLRMKCLFLCALRRDAVDVDSCACTVAARTIGVRRRRSASEPAGARPEKKLRRIVDMPKKRD